MTDSAEKRPGPSGAADGILVPEHFVPTPKTVSPQAQAFLRFKPPVESTGAPALLGDKEAWRNYRSKGDAGIVMISRQHAAKYPATVTTHTLKDSKLYEIVPKELDPDHADHAILYIHGGGFIVGGGEAAIYVAQQMAGMARMRVYSADYRMVPEVTYPEPLLDVLDAYVFLLKRHKPAAIALFGPSAGANLAPAMILKARDAGLPMPAACAMHSVPSDMNGHGDSEFTNIAVDIVLRERDQRISDHYANGRDRNDPYMSPVFGDYALGFPPSILTSGTRDLLLSGTVRLHRAMVRAGAKAELHVWEAMTHAPFMGAPEESELYMQHIDFMKTHLSSA